MTRAAAAETRNPLCTLPAYRRLRETATFEQRKERE